LTAPPRALVNPNGGNDGQRDRQKTDQ
jgi:hypothetical protein